MWESELSCEPFYTPEGTDIPNLNASTTSSQDILSYLSSGFCKLFVDTDRSRRRECSRAVTRSCDDDCSNTQLVDACVNGTLQPIHFREGFYVNYYNPYCAYCSVKAPRAYVLVEKIQCGYHKFGSVGEPPNPYNFATLFRYDRSSSNGASLPGDVTYCPSGQ